MRLRLACFQAPATDRPDGSPDPVADREANLAALDEAAGRAAAEGAQLIITPEMYLTGYNLGAEAVASVAEGRFAESAQAVSRIALKHGIAVLYGYPDLDGDGVVFNAVQLIGADGLPLANYRKTHLFGEVDRAAFAPGDELVVQADLDGVRVGLMICYDVEFPETVRAHADAGTQVLLVPTALMRPYEYVPRQIVPARAIESQLFVAYVNRVGVERDFVYAGESRVVAPDGRELAVGSDHEELLIADVDLADLAASREVNTYLPDRRTDLYGEKKK
ncbi:carbon-nitrogen hydrolase family protein [Catenulispora yoronensis]|uniref:Carbon-nitrogen hydrolase family protein n=1 Tax=Catenulispora yoronensis TaxID=450799 RepID=A0ABP5F337_9ACTN